MPEDGGSFTGRARRRSTSRAVRAFDLLARSLITFGGIGTIVAVLGVCLFLVWVVFPLFLPASIEHQVSLTPARDGEVPVQIGIDEYQNLGWALLADGRVMAFRLDTGDERVSRPLYTDRELTASSFPIGTEQAVLGFADGSVQIVGVEFETTFLDEGEIPASLASRVEEAVPGDLFDLDDGLVQVTREGQLRHQNLITTSRDAVALGDGPVRLASLIERPSGPLVSALVETGGAPALYLLEGREKEDFLTGETTFALDAPVALPYRPAGSGVPAYMALSGSGADIYIAWADGTFIRVNRGDPQAAFVAEEGRLTPPGVELTAMSFVLGDTTLAWAGADGSINAGFLIRRADLEVGARSLGQPTGEARAALIATKSLSTSGAAVRTLAPSGRSRLLLAGDAEGRIRMYNVTSATEIATVELESPDPVVRLGMSPKGDGFVAFAGDRFGHWNVDPRHPEANLNALFRPVWYEGYTRPEHTWQSSSGTDDFEPKLGLMPLIFGTVKATVYSMLFGVPLALMAAVFTSEFLHPRGRALIKPTIELMASLPSVVLGFLAALVFAPFVESVVASALAGFLTVPLSFLLGAYLWQLLPAKTCIRLGRWRFLIHVLLVPVGVLLAVWIGPLGESWLFAGDMKAWLSWYPGAPDAERFASSFGGWTVILLPVSAVAAVMAFGRWGDPVLRQWGARQERARVAQASLLKFVTISLLTVAIVAIVAAALEAAGVDPRGGLVATYVQRNALVVGFVMGFAVIPIIYTIAEDALSTVPEHLRSASLGTGATQWQTAVRIVIPTAMSGLFSAIMVGLGRAVGETMVVLMAAGNTPVMEWNVFEGFRTLSANIAVELPEAVRNSTHYRTLFLAALVLFAMTFVVNTVAEIIRLRFRKRAYQL